MCSHWFGLLFLLLGTRKRSAFMPVVYAEMGKPNGCQPLRNISLISLTKHSKIQ